MVTYQHLLQWGYGEMAQASLEDGVFECKELLSFVGKRTKAELLRDLHLTVASSEEEVFRGLLARRLQGEPLAYLLGEWDFYGRTFVVNENVLIPRLDTEVLAYRGIELAKELGGPVLDLCAGSGCVGIAIALEVLSVSVCLGEISPLARAVCEENISRHGLRERVVCEEMDCFCMEGRQPSCHPSGKYQVIVSNPPYIREEERDTLDESVVGFEPHLALFGGEDGYDFYRVLCGQWKHALLAGGHLLMEVGIGQYEMVETFLREEGFQVLSHSVDTQGIVRVVEGIYQG